MKWTPERMELLKELDQQGLKAREIADRLNAGLSPNDSAVTRNAVIGKLNRMRIENKPSAETPRGPKAKKTDEPNEIGFNQFDGQVPQTETKKPQVESSTPEKSGEPGQGEPSAKPVAEKLGEPGEVAKPDEPEKRKLSLMELTEKTCKWPNGDPATDDFWFCGMPSKPGKPYCEAHLDLAAQPISSRRDRRASQ